MRLLLNMIVRNEADKILRCLESVKPYIANWVIADTGSTDLTCDIISDYLGDLPGHITRIPFENFEQARNDALRAAREAPYEYDYILLMDADMQLVVLQPDVFESLIGHGYDMNQRAGSLVYANRRLISREATGWYRGVTHEYIDVPSDGMITGAYFIDHADGANRPNKFKRDIALLTVALQKEPDNARYWFYLGQSYRDAGQPAAAIQAYKKRIALGGWDQEVWNAQLNVAHCYKALGREADFISAALKAYEMRPSRAESLYDLAHYFRENGKNNLAAGFAKIGMDIPRSDDQLFVNDFVYTAGLREEFSISGFYNERTRPAAYKVTDGLALDPTVPTHVREGAKNNLFYYIKTLKEIAPSFTPRRLDFKPPANYTPMNPSVCSHFGKLYCVVRTVNYRITPEGRYAIVGPDDSINDSNPIHTRNFLVRLNNQLDIETEREILPPSDMPPPAYKLVVGFEDMRLISRRGSLWTSSCVRELNPEGYCEQVLARITEEGSHCRLDSLKVMHHEPRVYEKNWMPMPFRSGSLAFMYRLNTIVDEDGKTIDKYPVSVDIGQISGGSQLVPFSGGYLAVVHEASYRDGKRYYRHRFAKFDGAFRLKILSEPFALHDKQIEFVAGLAWHKGKLILSYGVRDAEAWVASIDPSDVDKVLA